MRFEKVKDESLLGDEPEMTLLPQILGKDESTAKPEYLFGIKINQQLAFKLTGNHTSKSSRSKIFDMSMVEMILDAVGGAKNRIWGG